MAEVNFVNNLSFEYIGAIQLKKQWYTFSRSPEIAYLFKSKGVHDRQSLKPFRRHFYVYNMLFELTLPNSLFTLQIAPNKVNLVQIRLIFERCLYYKG